MVGEFDHNRHSIVAGLANFGMDRNAREQLHSFLARHLLAAARAKYFVAFAAVGTDEITHVLDDTDKRAVYLAQHTHGPARIGHRDFLPRRDDHRAVDRNLLRQRELRIAGSGRQIDDQEILRAPQRILEKLAHSTHHHRAAPYHGRLVVEKKAHRDELHAILFYRIEILRATQPARSY